jgi:hypothetical protein
VHLNGIRPGIAGGSFRPAGRESAREALAVSVDPDRTLDEPAGMSGPGGDCWRDSTGSSEDAPARGAVGLRHRGMRREGARAGRGEGRVDAGVRGR